MEVIGKFCVYCLCHVLLVMMHIIYDVCGWKDWVSLVDLSNEDPRAVVSLFISPYDPKDRVNPDAQLDPKTGKSLEYSRQHKSQ